MPHCTVCSTDGDFDTNFEDIVLYRCPSCHHCWTDISQLKNTEKYTSDYFQVTHRNWFENPDFKLFQRILELILSHRKDAAVLDIGCGTGNLLGYLREHGPELTLTGIELSHPAPRQGIEFLCGDFLTFPIERQFDVVVSTQVIEHVTDPREFMNRIITLCRPGGIILTDTINESGFLFVLSRMLNKLGYKQAFERLYSRHHLNHFNLKSLRRLMERAGLEVVKMEKRNGSSAAMDVPSHSPIMGAILHAGVWGAFLLSGASGYTVYQIAVCQKPADMSTHGS